MGTKKNKLRTGIFFLHLYFSFIFFAIYSLLGMEYGGADNDHSFVYGYMALDTLILLFFIQDTSKRGINKGISSFLLLSLIVLLLYVIESPQNVNGINDGRLFLAETIPGILIAIMLSRQIEVYKFSKYFDLLSLVITGAIALNFRMFLSGSFGLGGTENYQALSYNSAMAFYLNFFSLLAEDSYFPRFGIFKNKAYRLLQLVLLPIQVLACIMSGGRGGAIVIIASVFLILYYTNKWNEKKYNTGAIVLVIVAVLVAAWSIIPKEYMDPIISGIERQFSYLTSSGIDMESTSNRDITYGEAIIAFNEKPLTGHGLFTYADRMGFYPHNIFLQILVQGGLLLFIPMMLYFSFVLLKMTRLLRRPENASLLLMAIHPFLLLLFSASYLREAVFWCVCVYVTLVSEKNANRKELLQTKSSLIYR